MDELLIAGELQESSKKTVARLIAAQVHFLFSLNVLWLQNFLLLLIAMLFTVVGFFGGDCKRGSQFYKQYNCSSHQVGNTLANFISGAIFYCCCFVVSNGTFFGYVAPMSVLHSHIFFLLSFCILLWPVNFSSSII